MNNVLPSNVRVTTLCCMSRDFKCRPDSDSKPGASELSLRCAISSYLEKLEEVAVGLNSFDNGLDPDDIERA